MQRLAEIDASFLGSMIQDKINHRPWIYIIASYTHKFIYVGETQSEFTIFQRLSEHFFSSDSSLRKNALKELGIAEIKGPFLINCFYLDDTKVEFSSKSFRLAAEFNVYNSIYDFLKGEYLLISNVSSPREIYNKEVKKISNEISKTASYEINAAKLMSISKPFVIKLFDI